MLTSALPKRAYVLIALLATCYPRARAAPSAAMAEATRVVEAALTELRIAEAQGDAGEERAAFHRAGQGLRALTLREVEATAAAGATAPPSRAARLAAVRSHLGDATGERHRYEALARSHATRVFVESSDTERVRRLAATEGRWRALRLRGDALREAECRLDPWRPLDGMIVGPAWQLRRGTSRATFRMGELGEAIAGRNHARPTPPPGVSEDAERWAIERADEMDLEEYRLLARDGAMVWPGTEDEVRGKLRVEAARNAMANLAVRLEASAVSRFLEKDLRKTLSEEVRAEIAGTPEFTTLQYLVMGKEPEPRLYMLAVALALRWEQDQIHKWFDEGYLPKRWEALGFGTAGNLHTRLTGGLGTTLRTLNLTGASGVDTVRRILTEFHAEVDAVAGAFEAAGKAKATTELGPAHRRLLQAYGYLVPDGHGGLALAIPATNRDLGALRGSLRLPGHTLLDFLSPKTLIITLTSVVVPEMMASRVSALTETTTLGVRAVHALEALTKIAGGAAVSAGVSLVEQGRIDAPKLLFDAVLVGTLANVAGIAGQVAAAFPINVILEKEPAAREALIKWVAGSLGLASDSMVQAYWEDRWHGRGPSWETFLGCLLNGIMARSVAAGVHAGAHRALIPEFLRPYLVATPGAREFLEQRAHQVAAHRQHAQERWMAATEGGQRTDALHVFRALGKGDLDWGELTSVYLSDPIGMRPLMEKIGDLRQRYVDEVAAEALRRLPEVAAKQYRADQERIQQTAAPGDRVRLLAEATARYESDLALASEKMKQPGSGSPTSDIDRSIACPTLRRLILQIHDANRRSSEEGWIPTTARAFDVNEYLDVFPFIDEIGNHRVALASQRAELEGISLTHAEAMEALSLAAAMMRMTESQRQTFRTNEVTLARDRARAGDAEGGSPEAEAARSQALFEAAHRSLRRGESELRGELRRLRLAPNDPDAELRARTSLYTSRGDSFRDGLFELERMAPGQGTPLAPSPPASGSSLATRARVERDLTYAMREGVETYSIPGGLYICVTMVQAKTKTVLRDGVEVTVPMKPADRIADPNFTLKGELRGKLTVADVRGMIRDQVMFLVEHMNHWRVGHEETLAAATDLAKYGERVVLGLHILGEKPSSLPREDPRRRLHDATAAFMAVKGDLPRMKAVLEQLDSGSVKTPEGGLLELARRLEAGVPGCAGLLLGNLNPQGRRAMETASISSQTLRYGMERETMREVLGSSQVARFVTAELAKARSALEVARAELARYRRLAGAYRAEDWAEVESLEEERRSLEMLIMNIPYWTGRDRNLSAAKARRVHLDGLLARRQAAFREVGGREGFGAQLDERAEGRVRYLEARVAALEAEQATETARAARDARFEALDLTGRWAVRGAGPQDIGVADLVQRGERVEAKLGVAAGAATTPVFSFEARHRAGRLRGRWADTRPATATGRRLAAGIFRAEVSEDGKQITIAPATTEAEGARLRWHGLRLELATPGLAATLDPGRFWEVRQVAADQAQPVTADLATEALEPDQGRLVVELRGVDGGRAAGRFDLLAAGTSTWVARGRSWEPLDVDPGRYDVRFRDPEGLWIRDRVVIAGRAVAASVPARGRVRLVAAPPEGGGPVVDLRATLYTLYQERRRVAVLGADLQADLLPGDYRLAVETTPDGAMRWEEPVQVTAGKITEATMRWGGVRVTVEGRQDPARPWSLEVARRDAPGTVVRRGTSEVVVALPPGRFDVEVRGPGTLSARYPLTIEAGRVAPLPVRWGHLKVQVRGGGGSVAATATITRDGRRDSTLLPAGEVVEVPPGRYELSASADGRVATGTATVDAGALAEVELELR